MYKVKLPNLIKVYPVFLPDKLQKAINNLLPRQKNEPPLLIKEILAYKLVRKTLKYRVSWKGYNLDPT